MYGIRTATAGGSIKLVGWTMSSIYSRKSAKIRTIYFPYSSACLACSVHLMKILYIPKLYRRYCKGIASLFIYGNLSSDGKSKRTIIEEFSVQRLPRSLSVRGDKLYKNLKLYSFRIQQNSTYPK
jgi:hypothetical protein